MLSRSLKYSLFGSLKKTNAAKEVIARILKVITKPFLFLGTSS